MELCQLCGLSSCGLLFKVRCVYDICGLFTVRVEGIQGHVDMIPTLLADKGIVHCKQQDVEDIHQQRGSMITYYYKF
jgi:hypothetical protein